MSSETVTGTGRRDRFHVSCGAYGKIPSAGDFVRRGLPRSFIDPFDHWLAGSLAYSKSILGQNWLATYLTGPIWRFALSAGICGEGAALGVMTPSVDSVNRHFPLVILTLHEAIASPFALATSLEHWFDRAESVALSCLDPHFTLELLHGELGKLEQSINSLEVSPINDICTPRHDDKEGFVLAVGRRALSDPLRVVCPFLVDRLLGHVLLQYSLWWTTGSEDAVAYLRAYRGLPPTEDFHLFLGSRTGGRHSTPDAGDAGTTRHRDDEEART